MLLKIENLSVSFADDAGRLRPAVEDASLELDRGQVLGLVGESGSGKSVTAMSIARLVPSPPAVYTGGRILFDGTDTLALPAAALRSIRGLRIGVVFQDPMDSLSPLHRVGDQLEEAVLLHRDVSRRAARATALEWLEKVGIPDPAARARAWPHELSGGMQQRVMIAMAMIHDPDLLIADEPTTALDVTVQAQILRLMKSLHTRNSGILFITHDLGVVYQMATKIAVMYRGRVVEKRDSAEEFFSSPEHPHSKELVAAARSCMAGEAR